MRVRPDGVGGNAIPAPTSMCAAIGRLEETIASLHDETAAAWSLPARLLLAQSYCGLGRYADAAPLIAELRQHAERGGTMFQAPVRETPLMSLIVPVKLLA